MTLTPPGVWAVSNNCRCCTLVDTRDPTPGVMVKSTLPLGLLLIAGTLAAMQIAAQEASQPTCGQVDVAKYGRPVLFPSKDGLTFGVSTQRTQFQTGEDIHVYVWLSNKSPEDFTAVACCEQTFLSFFELLDSSGHRIENALEVFDRKTKQQGREPVHVCTCSAVTQIRAGRCGVIDSGVLNRVDTAFDLQPGKYRIVPSEKLNKKQQRGGATEGLSLAIVRNSP